MRENNMISYKNDPKLKIAMLAELKKHRQMDAIKQGTYGKENGNWKGCAVACSLRSLAIIKDEKLVTEYNDHKRYETDLGIPEWLARLEDTIFEGLPVEEAKLWPEAFLKAIPVGIDLEPVKWKFCAYLMKENIERVLTLKISDELKKQVVDAIRQVLLVHEKAIETGEWNGSARSAAEAARSAAEAARSAAESESAESAWSAAESAAWAVFRSEAWYPARAAREAAWAAESAWAAYKKYSVELLKLLKVQK